MCDKNGGLLLSSDKEECEVHFKNNILENGHICQIVIDDKCAVHNNDGMFEEVSIQS